MNTSHWVLDGSVVEMESPDLDLATTEASSRMEVAFGDLQIMVAVGGVSFAEWYLSSSTGIALTESLKVTTGRISYGARFDAALQETHLAMMWQGDATSLASFGINVEPEVLLATLNRLDLKESDRSLLVEIAEGSGGVIRRSPDLAKHVDGLGMLLVERLTAQRARGLPSWSGTKVAGGELFIDRRNDSAVLKLITSTALGTVMPGSALELEVVADALSRLLITWHQG